MGHAVTWVVIVLGTFVVMVHLPVSISLIVALASTLGLVSLADEDRRATAQRVREALSILRIPIKTAAEQYMDTDMRSFERALAGEQKLDLWRLAMIGPEFRRVYALLELRDLGLPQLARTAIKIEPAVQSMKESA